MAALCVCRAKVAGSLLTLELLKVNMNSNIAVMPTTKPAFDLSPQTFEQALTFSQYLADSEMVPKDFKGKPGNCLIAMQWGAELGLKPLQALQGIAVINGRPSLWGDAVIALVRSSPACEYISESQTATEATCKVKRRGEPEQERTFSMTDAKVAGLLNKQGPWSQYPKRMMQMRARAFALRDVFPDVLKGMPVAEEVMDTPRDMGPAVVAQPKAEASLLEQAEAAASMGVATYQAFWAKASKEDRKSLAADHERLKAEAASADKSRTVDAAQKPAAKTFDEVMAMLCAATTLDALYVAGEWVNQFDSQDEVNILNAKFDEIKAALEGGAS